MHYVDMESVLKMYLLQFNITYVYTLSTPRTRALKTFVHAQTAVNTATVAWIRTDGITYPETEQRVSVFRPALGEQSVPLVRLPAKSKVVRLHARILASKRHTYGARALVIT